MVGSPRCVATESASSHLAFNLSGVVQVVGAMHLLLSPSVWVLLSPPYTLPCMEKRNKHQCAVGVKPESDILGNSMSAWSECWWHFFPPLYLRFLISTLCSHFSLYHQPALMVGHLLWYLNGDKALAQKEFPLTLRDSFRWSHSQPVIPTPPYFH